MTVPAPAVGAYLDHLPPALREGEFLGRFLLAFEAMVDGLPGVEGPGLQQEIDGLGALLDPRTTREEFLPWLAGWVGLTLRADWSPATARSVLSRIVPLYRYRGTREGLRRMLAISLHPEGDDTRDDVHIDDGFPRLPYFFQVRLTLPGGDRDRLRTVQAVARAVVDQEKPVHTFYALRIAIPAMRLVSEELRHAEGDRPELLVLGANTWLGSVD